MGSFRRLRPSAIDKALNGNDPRRRRAERGSARKCSLQPAALSAPPSALRRGKRCARARGTPVHAGHSPRGRTLNSSQTKALSLSLTASPSVNYTFSLTNPPPFLFHTFTKKQKPCITCKLNEHQLTTLAGQTPSKHHKRSGKAPAVMQRSSKTLQRDVDGISAGMSGEAAVYPSPAL